MTKLFRILFSIFILKCLPREIMGRKLLLRFLVIFYLTGLPIICIAQPSITWNKIYDGPIHNNDRAAAITQANSGNYFVFNFTSASGSQTYLLKINNFGDTLWSKRYPNLGDFESAVS